MLTGWLTPEGFVRVQSHEKYLDKYFGDPDPFRGFQAGWIRVFGHSKELNFETDELTDARLKRIERFVEDAPEAQRYETVGLEDWTSRHTDKPWYQLSADDVRRVGIKGAIRLAKRRQLNPRLTRYEFEDAADYIAGSVLNIIGYALQKKEIKRTRVKEAVPAIVNRIVWRDLRPILGVLELEGVAQAASDRVYELLPELLGEG